MSERKGEIKALTGLRGLAAIDVVLSHLANFIVDKHPVLGFLTGWSVLSVDLFFLLSALTLCLVYRPGTDKPLDLRKFFVARVARVYPLAIAALLVVGPYFSMWSDTTSAGRKQIYDGIRQLLLINHWPVIGSGQEWLGPLWSLSIEVFLYIFIFPALFFWGKAARRMSANKITISVVGFMFLRVILMSRDSDEAVLWFRLAEATSMFVAGYLIYLLYSFHRERWASTAQANSLMYFAIIAMFVCRTSGMLMDVKAFRIFSDYGSDILVLAPFLVGGLMDEKTFASRLLSSRPIYFLGQISYSIYVWHVLVRNYVEDIYINTLHLDKNIFFFLSTMSASILIATLSYFCFESPTRNFIRRYFLGRREEMAATSSKI